MIESGNVSAAAGMQQALRGCAEGRMPPNVALVHVYMQSPTRRAADAAIDAVELHATRANLTMAARLAALARLHRDHPEAWSLVHRMLGILDHDRLASPAEIAASFDAAAHASAEASVALYSLGDPALLLAATAEIIARLQEWRLIRSDTVALDIGCGTGRLETALADRVRTIIATDVSHAMLRVARATCALPNVLFAAGSGRNLASLRDRIFDLVIGVDSFPYIVAAGFAFAHIADAARTLKPGGNLLILNYSYRGDAQADQSDISAMAARTGLEMIRTGERPFTLWDGVAFQLRKPE